MRTAASKRKPNATPTNVGQYRYTLTCAKCRRQLERSKSSLLEAAAEKQGWRVRDSRGPTLCPSCKPKRRKRNDGAATFAHLASGVLASLQINEVMKRQAKKKVGSRRKAAGRKRNTAAAGTRTLSSATRKTKTTSANPRGQRITWVRDTSKSGETFYSGLVNGNYPPVLTVDRASDGRWFGMHVRTGSFTDHYATAAQAKAAIVKMFRSRRTNPRAGRDAGVPAAKNPGRRAASLAKTARRLGVPTTNGKKGELYLLTIKRGDDVLGVYVHDGKGDGLNKKFRTIAAARAFASRRRSRLVENPVQVTATLRLAKAQGPKAAGRVPNGIVAKFLAKLRADKELGRELREQAAKQRQQLRKAKAAAAKKSTATKRRKNAGTRTLSSAPRRTKTAAANPRMVRYMGCKIVAKGGGIYEIFDRSGRAFADTTKLAYAKTIIRNRYAKVAKRNPAGKAARVPTSKTFEMFQGRKPTRETRLAISEHGPRRLALLGDLVAFKLAGESQERVTNPQRMKLCAANGRMWFVGQRIARADTSQPARVLNPVGELEYVVYRTHKPHHGDPPGQHYIHRMGEEGGRRPLVCVDRQGFGVLKGGSYKIRAEGIRD